MVSYLEAKGSGHRKYEKVNSGFRSKRHAVTTPPSKMTYRNGGVDVSAIGGFNVKLKGRGSRLT